MLTMANSTNAIKQLVEKLQWILTEVLNVGLYGTVIGYVSFDCSQ